MKKRKRINDSSAQRKGNGNGSKLKIIQRRKNGHVTIKLALDSLEITAKFKDQEALERYHSEVLMTKIEPKIPMSDIDDLYLSLNAGIIHAVERYNEKKLPRGMHKSTHSLISYIKLDAGILYAYLSAWNKRPSGDQPEFIKKIIGMAKDELFYKVDEITEYCIKRIYEKDINRYQLKTLSVSPNFYQTYILGENDMVKNLKSHFKKLTPQVLAFQAFVYPSITKIFHALKVI